MRVAITGASGLIGTELTALLEDAGDEVVPVVRDRTQAGDTGVYWNPPAGVIETQRLAGVDGVVHLAGENVGAGRWSGARKQSIRNSRVEGTELLARTVASLAPPPRVFVAASAIGFYGDRGDRQLSESDGPGHGFLSEVCGAWEAATTPAREAGVRTVNLRIGVVLASGGGALARMLTPFRLGLGGTVGCGRQYVSWITLPDVCRAIRHCLQSESLSGPVNAVAPTPVTNRELTRALGRALARPTVAPLPAPLVRVLLGEMGTTLLLASTRVTPGRLLADGFAFEHERIDDALAAVLARA